MKILFILKDSVMHERYGVMILSSMLKSRGHDVRLVIAANIGGRALAGLVRQFAPSVIAYSAMTGEHIGLLEINRALKKERNFISVFGGPHATFFPELINEEGCDAICVGEGDLALPEFCGRVSENKAYWQTPNFIAKDMEGNIIRNDLMPLVEDLDSLPFADRSIMYEADPALSSEGHKIFFSTRGCPYKCTYCFNRRYNDIYSGKGAVLRHRSPESLIEEICLVKKNHPLDVVWIDDDTFLLKPRGWFNRFSRLYKERVALPLSCNVRANVVTDEAISLLKDTGLDSVWMGIECGDENLANTVLERGLSNEEIINAARIIKKYSVKLVTQNLIGLPVDKSYKVDLRTLDLNIKIKPAFAWSSILYPYPGTPVNFYARKNGFISGDVPFLETNKRFSVFKFSAGEKRNIENLHKLFGLMARFTILRRHSDFLCSLPLGGIYNCLFYLWYGYNMKMKLYPFKNIIKEIGSYLKLWFKFVKKT